MPGVGDGQRSAGVVGMVSVIAVLSFYLWAPPAAGQLITLPSPSTTVSPTTTAPRVTTTEAPDRTTTTTASALPTATTSRRAPASTSSTARRPSPTTTEATTRTTSAMDNFPTIERGDPPSTFRTPTTPDTLPLEQAATSTRMSTGSLVAMIIAGLLAVAVALSLLTVRYVRATRPGDGFPEP